MAIDADFLPHLSYFALGIDQVRAALDPHRFFAVHILFPPSPVLFADLVRFIREQRKVQRVLVDELLVRGRAIGANPQDDGSEFFELFGSISKRTGFFGATGRIVFGINLKNHRGSFEIGQFDFLALGVNKSESWSFGAYFEPIRHSALP